MADGHKSRPSPPGGPRPRFKGLLTWVLRQSADKLSASCRWAGARKSDGDDLPRDHPPRPLLSTSAQDRPLAAPPNRLQLLGRIAGHAWQQARAEGLSDGLRVLLGAGRMLGEREVLNQLFAIPAFAQLMAAQPHTDALFFISHRFFLSRDFGGAERVACVLNHFRFEQAHLSPALLPALHGDGLRLWRHGADYDIRLRTNPHTRHEGPLNLALRCQGRAVHDISFAWIDARQLGPQAGHGPVLFATRNQSAPPDSPMLARFRADFPQNSPAYFVLAALHALAERLGHARIVGVRDRCQIAFEPEHAVGFKRSYDDFWLSFGGLPLGHHGYEMPVPAQIAPLEQLKAKHRARARQRREHWRQVNDAAQQALSPYTRP